MQLRDQKPEESGFIILLILFLITVAIFGVLAFNAITKSREAEVIRDSAGEVIDTAKQSVDAVNEAKEKAEQLIN